MESGKFTSFFQSLTRQSGEAQQRQSDFHTGQGG